MNPGPPLTGAQESGNTLMPESLEIIQPSVRLQYYKVLLGKRLMHLMSRSSHVAWELNR